MLKGEQGYGYSFDPERAIGHLADPEGIESMALGAIGGAVQTFLSEMVSRDNDVSSAKTANLSKIGYTKVYTQEKKYQEKFSTG